MGGGQLVSLILACRWRNDQLIDGGGGQLVSLITIHGRALLNGLLFDVNGLLDFTSVPLSAGHPVDVVDGSSHRLPPMHAQYLQGAGRNIAFHFKLRSNVS